MASQPYPSMIVASGDSATLDVHLRGVVGVQEQLHGVSQPHESSARNLARSDAATRVPPSSAVPVPVALRAARNKASISPWLRTFSISPPAVYPRGQLPQERRDSDAHCPGWPAAASAPRNESARPATPPLPAPLPLPSW